MKRISIVAALLLAGGIVRPVMAENGVSEKGNGNYTVTFSDGSKIEITGVQPMGTSTYGNFGSTSMAAKSYLAEPVKGTKKKSLSIADRTLIDKIAAIEGDPKTLNGNKEVNLSIAVATGYAMSGVVGKDLTVTDVSYNAFDGKTYTIDNIKDLEFAGGEANGMKELTRVMGFLGNPATKSWFDKSKKNGDDIDRNIRVNGLDLFDTKGNPITGNLSAGASIDVKALTANVKAAVDTIKDVVQESGGGDSGGGSSSGGSSSSGDSCFVADTPVLMSDGSYKFIADIMVGDEVTSFDFETGEQVANKVLRLFQSDTEGYLRLNDGLFVTEGHPFAVGGDEWVTAGNLRTGDRVIGEGGLIRLYGIERIDHAVPIFNLTVDGSHNYYVAETEDRELKKTLRASADGWSTTRAARAAAAAPASNSLSGPQQGQWRPRQRHMTYLVHNKGGADD